MTDQHQITPFYQKPVFSTPKFVSTLPKPERRDTCPEHFERHVLKWRVEESSKTLDRLREKNFDDCNSIILEALELSDLINQNSGSWNCLRGTTWSNLPEANTKLHQIICKLEKVRFRNMCIPNH